MFALEISNGLKGLEFVFPIMILIFALTPWVKRTKIGFAEDAIVAFSFVIYLIMESNWLIGSEFSSILIAVGIISISLIQYLQKEDMNFTTSSAILLLAVLLSSNVIKEWLLLIHVTSLGLHILRKLQNEELSEIGNYNQFVLVLHILFIQSVSPIFTILGIIIGLEFYYLSKLLDSDNLVELIFISLIASIIISIAFVWRPSILLYKAIVGYFFLSLYLYRISKVETIDQTVIAYRVLGLLSFFVLNLSISFQYNSAIYVDHEIILGLITLTSLALSYYVWSATSNFVFDVITIVSLSASVPVLPEVGSLIVLGVIVLNIAYMAISVLSGIQEIGIEELSIFGLSYLILGGIQSYFPYITSIDGMLLTVFDYSWIATYLIWLSSALLQIYQSSLELNIGGFATLNLNSRTDMVFTLLSGNGIVMISWSNLTSITILLFFSIIMGIGTFFIIILNSDISLEKSKPIDQLFIGFFITAITGLFAVIDVYIEILFGQISGVVLFIIFSLLPIIFGLIVYTNRGYRKLELEQINRERLYVYLFAALIISLMFINFQIFAIPIIFFAMAMFTWCILLIGAWNNEVLITTLGSIFVYSAAYVLGNSYQYHVRDAEFSASIPIVIFIAVVVVLYLFRAELEMRFQLGHHPLLLVSIAALIVTTFQIDNLRLIGSSTSVATTIVTVLFSFVGALTYVYGTKFVRGRYKSLGIGLILLNMVRGLTLFLSRLAGIQGSREGDPILSLISFAWATLMIMVVGGIRSLSQRENLNRVLSAFFTPIKREELAESKE